MNNIIKLFFAFFILISSTSAFAGFTIVCNKCGGPEGDNFYRKAASKALREGDQMRGWSGVISVANFLTGEVKTWHFNVQQRFMNNGEIQPQIVAVEGRAASAELMRKVNTVSNSDLAALLRKKVIVPASSGFSSAWDIARTSSNRDALDQWYRDTHSFNYHVTTFTSAYGGAFAGFLNQIEVSFKFADGSTLIMVAPSIQSASLNFSYKFASSKDVDNNVIPDAGTSIEGRYTFSSMNNLREFLEHIQETGIRVRVIHGNGGSAGRPYVTITVH